MLKNLNNLTQRIIVGLGGMFVILFALIYSQNTYFFAIAIIAMLSQYEFYRLSKANGIKVLGLYGVACGMVLFVITYFINSYGLSPKWLFLIFPLMSVVMIVKLYNRNDSETFKSVAFTTLGMVYVAVPFSLFHFIAFHIGTYSPVLVLGILFLLWASDTGAYFAGVYLGRRKLFERISPKKSWEGFIGGTILNLLVAYGFWYLFDTLPLWQWLSCGLIIAVTGTYGDLVESMFKRGLAIKDSGSLLPGHGGFLDRFDAFIIAVPFVVAFLKLGAELAF